MKRLIPPETKAVIFDMDGVLWQSDGAHEEAYRRTLEPLGINVPPYHMIAGRRTDEVIKSLLTDQGIHCTEDNVVRLTAKKRAAAHRLLGKLRPVAKNCQPVLRSLAIRWRLALVSSASADNVELFLKSSGTGPLFSVILTGNDVTRAKPDPTIYMAALSRLAVSAAEGVVVEDAVSGIRAARRAGIRVIAMEGTCTATELGREDILAVITDLADLLDAGPTDS